VLQPLSGDAIGKFVYQTQPAKFAAMEGEFETMPHAPLHIGEFPIRMPASNAGPLRFPRIDFLAAHDTSAQVTASMTSPDRWPNVVLTHFAFEAMSAVDRSSPSLPSLLDGCACWRSGALTHRLALDDRSHFAGPDCTERLFVTEVRTATLDIQDSC